MQTQLKRGRGAAPIEDKGPALENGQEIAEKYRLVRRLGQGGFGETWEANDLATQQQVAIKALDLSRVGNWKAVELFEREARMLESLDHPKIPAYLDFIPVESDRTGFLIQELAPGADLERIIASGRRFTQAEARDFALKMLDVLEYLYSKRPPVVHRDIKPSNILMDEDDDIHLVDFGSVQDVNRRHNDGGSTVAGTFGYMAPEQLRGAASPGSDLYGLGMTLLFTLCGKDPSEMPEKRLKIDVRKVAKIDDDFAEFLERLIEPIAEDRFASPVEAREFLEHQGLVYSQQDRAISGSNIAALVQAEAAKEEAAFAKDRSTSEKIANKLKRRASAIETSEGWLIEIKPTSFDTRYVATLPAGIPVLFLGLVVVGQGPFWGMLVWAVIIVGLAGIFAKYRGKTQQLTLTHEGYYALQENGQKVIEAGHLDKLNIVAEANDGIGNLIVGGCVVPQLHPADVELVQRIATLARRARFLRALNESGVEYLIVNEDDMSPRVASEGLKILIRPSRENAEKLSGAMESVGSKWDDYLSPELFTRGFSHFVELPPYDMDIVTDWKGKTFEEYWESKKDVTIANLTFSCIRRKRV